jgi:PqqD family protein of HPr-rel-A system
MTDGQSSLLYRCEPHSTRIVKPLDAMTLIYQRRSGITHIVADPVPQILAAMGDMPTDARLVAETLASEFDLGDANTAVDIIAARLYELEQLGLVERVNVGRVHA